MQLRAPSDTSGRIGTILALVLGLGLAAPAMAHHRTGGPTSGLAIPSLTHGRMRVIAMHRADVLALADGQIKTDPTFRRLRNFIALQHASCLWGLMPGSLSDEASPFNECTHADLAAVQALLRHMRDMPAAQAAARGIEDRIATAERAEAEPVLCRFSDEPFNTADMIAPRWSEVPGHPPTSLACLSMLAFGTSIVAGLWAGTRRRTAKPSARPTRPDASQSKAAPVV